MSIYSRFGGLSALIDALVLDGFRQFGSALQHVAPTGNVVEDLIEFASAYRTWVLTQPDLYRLMMTAGNASYRPSETAQRARRLLIEAVAERVTAARAARSSGPAPITAEEAAKVVISMLHGMLLLEIDGVVAELGDSTEWAQRFASVIRFGLSQPSTNAA